MLNAAKVDARLPSNRKGGMLGVVPPNKRKGYIRKRLLQSWQLYVLLLPGLIYLLIFSYGPMYGIQIAFKDYRVSKGIWGSPWVGLKHFITYVTYPKFWSMMRNTLSISLYGLALFPAPIIFALLLNEIRHDGMKKAVQMLTYMPHFLSEVVVCALILLLLDTNIGPINSLITALGGKKINFMGIPSLFSTILVLSGVWQNLGWNSILYISALSGISPDLVDAARIDGAKRLQIILHVYLPGILPTIIITFLLSLGGILNVGYTKILLLQNDMNLEVSTVISLYTYNVGILKSQYSLSSAVGLFNNLINITVLLLANFVVRKISDTSLF